MAETPAQCLPPSNTCSSRATRFWKTPLREALKTPRTHRLLASAGPKTPHGASPKYSYEGLLHKTWRVHTLSPLYKFKTSQVSLKQYARSLDIAFSKGSSLSGQQCTQSSFSIYHGLAFNSDDADAVRMQVTERQDDVEKVVLTAILCSVDVEDPGVVEGHVSQHFTYYPLLLVCGTKQRADILVDWIQRQFDCRSSPLEFTSSDLRWLLALGCGQGGVASQPTLLRYNLSDVCDGINTIDCKFESVFCKEVWDKLQDSSSNSEEFVTEDQISVFVSALEAHLEYTMHILFSNLSLSEVGTPMCYVSKDGKLKILDSKGVYVILHMICDVITWKYVQGFGFFG